MTRILEGYAENLAGSTTTSTSSTNAVLTTSHTGEASTQYMVFAFIKLAKDAINNDVLCSLVNTTAGTTYQNPAWEQKDTTDSATLMLLGQYTAAATPVSNSFELRVWNETSGTITWSEAVIFLIKKDSTDGIGESTGDTTITTTPNDKISMSLSVSGNGRYVIFYAVQARTADTDFPPASARIDIDGVDHCIRRWKSKDATSDFLLHGAFPVDLTDGTRDIDLEVVGHGGSLDNVTFSEARVFALRQSTFDAVHDVIQTTRQTNSTDDTYADVTGASETQTLPAVDHLVIASAAYDLDNTGLSAMLKFQQSIGGSNADIAEVTTEPSATADRLPFTIGYRLEATAVEHIWKFQHAPESLATVGTTDAAIMVFQVEASSSNATGTASYTEGSDTISASGTFGDASGSGAYAESADTISASGTFGDASGSADYPESSDTVSAAGEIGKATGSASYTEASDTAAASGSQPFTGTASYTESADTASGAGAQKFIATASYTESADTASGAATHEQTGSAAYTESADTASATGEQSQTGAASYAEADDTVSATGEQATTGDGAYQEAADTANASAQILEFAAAAAEPTPGRIRKPIRRKPAKHRWAVWTGRGYKYFNTPEEAHAFLYPESLPRRGQRRSSIRELGPSLSGPTLPPEKPRITYAGEDISALTVGGIPAAEAFRIADRILIKQIERQIQLRLAKLDMEQQEEEEILMLLAAIH